MIMKVKVVDITLLNDLLDDYNEMGWDDEDFQTFIERSSINNVPIVKEIDAIMMEL